MTVGKATVEALDLAQTPPKSVEKIALYVGVAATGRNTVNSIGPKTDLVNLFGAEASGTLVKQLAVAQQNGGQDFFAYAIGIDLAANFEAAIDLAFATINAEYIVITDPVADAAGLTALQTKANAILTANARRVFFIACTAGINPATETWAAYKAAQAAITSGVDARRAVITPLLFGTDLGALAGRLSTNKASIADSPMRVATGSVAGLGAKPVDVNGVALEMSDITALEASKFSCVQCYEDYAGYYFTDANTLQADGGDYPVIEYLRVVDKAARQVRVLAIKRIADRKVNSTKKSIEAAKAAFGAPILVMAKTTQVAGQIFPGEVEAPKKGFVSINWPTKTKLKVGITVTPYNSPKEISVGIGLDLSN